MYNGLQDFMDFKILSPVFYQSLLIILLHSKHIVQAFKEVQANPVDMSWQVVVFIRNATDYLHCFFLSSDVTAMFFLIFLFDSYVFFLSSHVTAMFFLIFSGDSCVFSYHLM